MFKTVANYAALLIAIAAPVSTANASMEDGCNWGGPCTHSNKEYTCYKNREENNVILRFCMKQSGSLHDAIAILENESSDPRTVVASCSIKLGVAGGVNEYDGGGKYRFRIKPESLGFWIIEAQLNREEQDVFAGKPMMGGGSPFKQFKCEMQFEED